jgi:hypothetical protein
MVIENIRPGCRDRVYERFHRDGRMMPPGLFYLNSWLEKNGHRCFQLMETNDGSLFSACTARWNDLVDFEIIEIGEKPAAGE